MVEIIVVLLIIAGAAPAVGIKLYKTLTGKGGCACAGSNSCSSKNNTNNNCCGQHNHN